LVGTLVALGRRTATSRIRAAESRGQAAELLAEQIQAVLRPGLTEQEIRAAAERLPNLAA
jgi:hypothetical protein